LIKNPALSLKTFLEIKAESQKAVSTIDNLPVLAGLLTEQSVEFDLIDMSDIITYIIEERLADRIQKHQIQIAEIWPTVPGYRPWLEDIWLNYLRVALKYGGKSPRLELGANPIPPDKARFLGTQPGGCPKQRRASEVISTKNTEWTGGQQRRTWFIGGATTG
jgi:light-regulated signal transduction histidine kinase (bacteriophytochrome)